MIKNKIFPLFIIIFLSSCQNIKATREDYFVKNEDFLSKGVLRTIEALESLERQTIEVKNKTEGVSKDLKKILDGFEERVVLNNALYYNNSLKKENEKGFLLFVMAEVLKCSKFINFFNELNSQHKKIKEIRKSLINEIKKNPLRPIYIKKIKILKENIEETLDKLENEIVFINKQKSKLESLIK